IFEAGRRSAHFVLRNHPAQRGQEFRQREFQSALRGARERAGAARQFVRCNLSENTIAPLTLILSPHPRGEAKRRRSREICKQVRGLGRLSSLKRGEGRVRSL